MTWNSEPGAYYTLLFSDPDIPEQFHAKEALHWLVVNIPGNDISKGDVIFDYMGCGPPKVIKILIHKFKTYESNIKFKMCVFREMGIIVIHFWCTNKQEK